MLLIAQPRRAVVTFAIVYHVGSRNEAVGYTGATHLLEHLMFKGTPEYSREKGTAIAAVLEALGARFNATTWFDRTNYYETIPSDRLEVAVQLEASRMRGSLLRDEDRAPEMTVVRNEFERGENSPFQVLYKDTFAIAFREHPYHHPTIGWRSDIEGVTTARLKEFYDVFYHPNNATAMVIGDFEEADALASDRAPLRHDSAVVRADPRRSTRSSRRRRGSGVSSSGAPDRSPGARSRGGPSRRATPTRTRSPCSATCSAAGVTSRLYQALVEKSLCALGHRRRLAAARSRRSSRSSRRCGRASSSRRSRAVIRGRGRARRRATGVTDAELEKARTQIEAEVIFDRDSTDQIAASLSEAIAVADWEWYADYTAAIRGVTPEDVQRVAGDVLPRRRADGRHLPAEAGQPAEAEPRRSGEEEEA